LTAALDQALAVGRESVLDVGCGDQGALLSRVPDLPYTVGVDAVVPPVEGSDAPRHSDYVQMDVRSLGERFEPRQFATVVALDVIEHLTRDEGFALLEAMEQIASKRVIVFTPNGFLPQEPTAENPLQEHVSGWTVDDFERRGYRLTGINGWRGFRGPYAAIRWRPRRFWHKVAQLSEHLTEGHPAWAFQLFATKDVP
jgi:hypothetical protein